MARSHPRAGARDMVLSLAVLLVPIVLIVWFFQRVPDEPPLPTVDWKPVAAKARVGAGFVVLAPAALPQGWQPTLASFVKAGESIPGGGSAAATEFRLGVLNSDRVNLALRQAKPANVDQYFDEHSRSAFPTGSLKINNDVWQTHTSADGRTNYLLLERSDSVVLVSGDTSPQSLAELAGLLTAN